MTLFETYEQKKKDGETLDFSKLSREELKQIWFDDGATDFYIAKLFDVTPYVVNKRRRELNLMWKDCIWESCMEQPEFKKMVKQYAENNSHTINNLKHILNQQTVNGGDTL